MPPAHGHNGSIVCHGHIITILAYLHRGYDFSEKVPKIAPQYGKCPTLLDKLWCMCTADKVACESRNMGDSWGGTSTKLQMPIQTLQYQNKLGQRGVSIAAGNAKRVQTELNSRFPNCCPSQAHSLDFSDKIHEPVFFGLQMFRGTATQTRDCTEQGICARNSSGKLRFLKFQ